MDSLADASQSSTPSRERQVSIDAQIRSRMEAELARLRNEEAEVREQIEASLERENIDSEVAAAAARKKEGGEEAEGGESLHSGLLLGDIEEVRQKIDKFHGKSQGEESPASIAGQALALCYRWVTLAFANCHVLISATGTIRRERLIVGERCLHSRMQLHGWRRCDCFLHLFVLVNSLTVHLCRIMSHLSNDDIL